MDFSKVNNPSKYGTVEGQIVFIRCSCYLGIASLFIIIVFTSGCVSDPGYMGTPTLQAEIEARPTPESTLPELIENLSSDEPLARVVSAYALRNYDPDEVAIAVPSLVENLHHDYSEVQTSAAFLLGWLGSRAQQAVPDLITMMENNENPVYVRTSAVSALGKIGSVSAVPALAKQLYQGENDGFFKLEKSSAESIAMLTHQKFRDVGDTIYHYSDGIPWIVTDARSWWEQQGQYQDWGK